MYLGTKPTVLSLNHHTKGLRSILVEGCVDRNKVVHTMVEEITGFLIHSSSP